MDFEGQFKLRNGEYGYPLTVTDHYSRKVLLRHGLPSVKEEGVKPLLEKLVGEVGLPVWWMKLGIAHQRIHPSREQQKKSDAFCDRYNGERPHESLGRSIRDEL